MKKIIGVLLSLIMIVGFAACSKEETSDTENVKDAVTQEEQTQDDSENTDAAEDTSSLEELAAGSVYSDGQLSYNIIGIRTNTQGDYNYLILKLEVYNGGSEDVSFSAFDRLTVYGGDTEYMYDITASVESSLTGTITPGNKIMGEAAFDITESVSDNYVLYIGEGFEYEPAIKISAEDIGETFAEQFESSGVASDYTIGVPVESSQLSVLLNSATVTSCDKEGKEVLLLDMSITNNSGETQSFMLSLNFDGVYTADGLQLDNDDLDWTLGSSIEPGETVNGIASFYIDAGERDFYITVTPDLDDYSNKENIVFSAE